MIAAIIQARMGSTRLPGKVLLQIAGRSMIEHVVRRVRAARCLDRVILATTQEAEDIPLLELAKQCGIDAFAGSPNDVLDRYCQASRLFGVDVVVRITADCPLADPVVIDEAVNMFRQGHWDYVSTAYPVATFPDGLDVEVFSRDALERAWREASLPSEREHVTTYIWKNPKLFRLKSLVSEIDLSALRWTVDEECDLEFVREIYRHLDDGAGCAFGMKEVLGLLDKHPEIAAINKGIRRNEGYEKSLKEDLERKRGAS